MRTLVIHPEDYTTRFLAAIYEGKDWTVITTEVIQKELKQQIEDHDRIIMLGHGLPLGLLGFGRIFINEKFTPLLRKKKVVCVWCNADKFVEQHRLKGFYTGMIISEDSEAHYFGVKVDNKELLKSNWDFAYALRDGVDQEEMLDVVKSKYVGDTPIYNFNKERVYSNLWELKIEEDEIAKQDTYEAEKQHYVKNRNKYITLKEKAKEDMVRFIREQTATAKWGEISPKQHDEKKTQ